MQSCLQAVDPSDATGSYVELTGYDLPGFKTV